MTDLSPEWLKYANQGAIRNKPLSPELINALSFMEDMGITMKVFSGGQPAKGSGKPRVGSTRHDHGHAADVFFYKDGRRLDWSKPEDLPIFEEIVRRARANGVTGIGAGPGYMARGSMHIGFGSEAAWGAGGRGRNAPGWLRDAYNGAPAGTTPDLYIPQAAPARGMRERMSRQFDLPQLPYEPPTKTWEAPTTEFDTFDQNTYGQPGDQSPDFVASLPNVDYRDQRGPGYGPIDQSWSSAFGDAFSHSYIYEAVKMAKFARQFEWDDNFDVISAMRNDGMEKYWRYLGKARNAEHYEGLKKRLQEHSERAYRMEQWDGWFAHAAGYISNPDSLITLAVPVGSAAGFGLRATLKGGAKWAAPAGAAEFAIEKGRREVFPDTPFLESVSNVGAATLLSGLMGGIAGNYAGAYIRREMVGELTEQFAHARGVGRVTSEIDVGRIAKGVVEFDHAPQQTGRGVRIDGTRVLVDPDLITRRFRSGSHGTPATTPQELMEYEVARAASMSRASSKAGGRDGIESITPMTSVGENGRIVVDTERVQRAWAEDDVVALGPAPDTPMSGRLDQVIIPAKAFSSPEKAAEWVQKSAEMVKRARDNAEYNEVLREALKADGEKRAARMVGQQQPKAPSVGPEAARAAEADAEQHLKKYREQNNEAIRTARAEAVSRMVDSPIKRVIRNAATEDARNLAYLLAGDGAFLSPALEEGVTVGPSVYSRSRVWQGQVDKLYRKEGELYEKYLGFKSNPEVADVYMRKSFNDGARADGTKALNVDEWRKEVTQSLITGKPSQIPEANEMVTALREMFKDFEDAGNRFGILRTKSTRDGGLEALRTQAKQLENEIIEGKGGVGAKATLGLFEKKIKELEDAAKIAEQEPSGSYFTRIFNKRKIEENRDFFKEQIVKKWMRQQPVVQVWEEGQDELAYSVESSLRELRSARTRGEGIAEAQAKARQARVRFDKAPPEGKYVWEVLSTTEEAIEKRAEEFMRDILMEADNFDKSAPRFTSRPSFGKRRQFDVPNEMLLMDGPNGNKVADFIDTDYMHVAATYTERMAPAIEFARSFARHVDGIDADTGFEEALDKVFAKERAAFSEHFRKQRSGQTKGRVLNDFEKENPEYRDMLDGMSLFDVKLKPHDDPKLRGWWEPSENTIYVRPGEPGFVVAHEAMHAIFTKAGLAKKWGLLQIGKIGERFEQFLKISDEYQPEWAMRKAAGISDPKNEEYAAQIFGLWASRRVNRQIDTLLDLVNKAGEEDGLPAIKLNAAERKAIDAAFTKMMGKIPDEDMAFWKHWNAIERDIKHLRDRVTNRVYRDPNRWDNRTATALRNWAQLAFMGMSAIPAVTELGMIINRHGLSRTMQHAFGELDASLKMVRDAGIEELRRAGGSMEVVRGAALSRFIDLGVEPTNFSKAEHFLHVAANKYFLWNGLAMITTRLKEIDAGIRVSDTLERISRVTNGTSSKADIAELARWGLTKNDAQKIMREPIEWMEDAGWLANTDKWADQDLAHRFRSAIAQGNENTIMAATAADKPTIMDGVLYLREGPLVNKYAERMGLEKVAGHWRVQSGMMSLPFLFWNYAIAAHNKILVAGLDEPTTNALTGIVSMVGMGYIVAAVREPEWRWDQMSMDERLMAAIDHSGVSGIFAQAWDVFDQPSMGGSGMRAIGAGPAVAANLAAGIAEGDLNRASWAMPLRNHFLLKDMWDSFIDRLEGSGLQNG